MVKPIATPQIVRFSPFTTVHKTPRKEASPIAAKRYEKTRPSYLGLARGDAKKERNLETISLFRELDGIEFNRNSKARHRDATILHDDSSDWDEESTLAAMADDERLGVDEREELAALAEQLKVPMNALSQRLKQQLKGAIIPAIQQIKQVHDKLEEEVDAPYHEGLIAFDDTCKSVEAKILRDEDELKAAYNEMQRNTEKLVEQLQEAYCRREQLWIEFEEKLEGCAAIARAAVEGIPAEVEDAIAALEKKSRNTEKKSTGLASKQKMLKGLLEKL